MLCKTTKQRCLFVALLLCPGCGGNSPDAPKVQSGVSKSEQGKAEEKRLSWEEIENRDNEKYWKIRREAPPLTIVRILSPSSLLGKWGPDYYVFAGTDRYVNMAGEAEEFVVEDREPSSVAERILRYSLLDYYNLRTRTWGVHPQKTDATAGWHTLKGCG